MPNGAIVLGWSPSSAPDADKYVIYQFLGGINTSIAINAGKNNTIYTYTSSQTPTTSVTFLLAADDSCNNRSPLNIGHKTMFLKADYDRCGYSSTLNWNPFLNMPKGLLEYRIYYSVSGGNFNVVGTTTLTTFTHTNVTPGQNITYYVRAFNTPKTITSSSNRTTFFSSQAVAPSFVYLRSASVLNNEQVEINLYVDSSVGYNGLTIYRSTNNVDFSSVAFLPSNTSQFYSFTDLELETNKKPYFYKAIIKDSCGNERTFSNTAKTILLKVKENKDNDFLKSLHWNSYQGFNAGVSGYNIYRVMNGVRNNFPVTSTTANDTILLDNVEEEAANGAKVEYVVEAIESLGNVYGLKDVVNSNNAQIYLEDRLFIPTAFAPNGVNKVWLPVTHFVEKTEYNVKIFNRYGAKIFETGSDSEAWDGGGSKSDVYVYLISYKNSRGEYKQLKGTVALLE
jgi:gliding motility-associated-like protein